MGHHYSKILCSPFPQSKNRSQSVVQLPGHCHEYLGGAVEAETQLDDAIVEKLRQRWNWWLNGRFHGRFHGYLTPTKTHKNQLQYRKMPSKYLVESAAVV